MSRADEGLWVSYALAITGAMRLDGITTPVSRRVLEVWAAASAIETKMSAQSIWAQVHGLGPCHQAAVTPAGAGAVT